MKNYMKSVIMAVYAAKTDNIPIKEDLREKRLAAH